MKPQAKLHFSDEQLLKLNKIGLIPGPGETSEAFTKRADYCLHLKNNLSEEMKADLGAEISPPEFLDPALAKLKDIYDIAPVWIPLLFSNFRLPFWHGGCAWIYQMTEESPTAALVQLRRRFRTSPNYLGIYHRDELLTHELCHVGRMMFQEARFEEMLAYRTSNSSFRRWLGPIAQSSMESVIFLLVIFMLTVFDIFLITLGRPDAYTMALWLKLLPVAMILAGVARLWKRQNTLQRCLKNLTVAFGKNHSSAILYRLTDKEIDTFSKMPPQEIKVYAVTQAPQELRWRVIHLAYPSV